MSNGWVSIWRELFEKPIWLNSTPEHKVILITVFLMANHKPNQWEWKGVKCIVDRGQFITSAKSIIECAGQGITRQNVRGALLRFEKLGFLTNESTKTGCRLTICNYNRYQKPNGAINQAINQEVTKHQPRGNQEVTTNNKDNNNNNDNKKKRKVFAPPSVEEVKEYILEKGYSIDPNNFVDFYESKGWMVGRNKMKAWKAGVRNWNTRQKKETNNNEEMFYDERGIPTTKAIQNQTNAW